MRYTPRTRLLAAFVAALFFGGIGGAGDVDAVLFHGAAAAGATRVHWERTGTTSHHADNCLLTFRVATGRGSVLTSLPLRFEGIPRHDATPRPTAVPVCFSAGLHQDSRAPPFILA